MLKDNNTISEKMVKVAGGHQLYAQLWGAKDGEPVVFLHGGPGGSCSDKHKLLFDPSKHKVLFFDQRGSGNSLPKGSIVINDTDNLVEDINKLTKEFGLTKFTITGGSWGSCLALVYAIRYPKLVNKLVIRGIFTGRQKEVDFLYKGMFRYFYPKAWSIFENSVPEKYKSDPSAYHLPRVLGKDKSAAKQSAYAYAVLEGSVVSLDDRIYPLDYENYDPSSAIVECHYRTNKYFLPDNYVLNNLDKLTMPIVMIQGRFDFMCPPSTAFELSTMLPNAELFWTIAGHSGSDRANWGLTKATLAILTC